MTRRPTAYDRDQHEMVCRELGVSPDPGEPGDTALEAVCGQQVELVRLRARIGQLEEAVTGCAVVVDERGRHWPGPTGAQG
jgi:hypothetical protein